MLIFDRGLRKTLPRPSASRQEELKRRQRYALQAPGMRWLLLGTRPKSPTSSVPPLGTAQRVWEQILRRLFQGVALLPEVARWRASWLKFRARGWGKGRSGSP